VLPLSTAQLSTQSNIELPSVSEEAIERYSREMGEPSWLKEFRLKSYNLFKQLEVETSPLFQKYSDLSGVDFASSEYLRYSGKHTTPLGFTQLADATFIAHAEGHILRVPEELSGKGVIIETIDDAARNHPDLLKRVFHTKAVRPEDDKFAAFSNALFDTGVFVYVPKYVYAQTPVRLTFLATDKPVATVSQILVFAEENSFVGVVEEGYSISQGQKSVAASITDIQAAEGAKVAFSSFNGYSTDVSVFTNRKAVIGKDANVSWTLTHLGGGYVRGRLDNLMRGSGGSIDDIEVLFGDGSQRFDMTSDINFETPQTTGTVLAKAVLKDSAKSLMKGTIKIRKGAKNSRGFLSIHAMLLSKQAVAEPIPALEIDTNDVKATHSAAVEQIDPEQVFYLATKGLQEDTARRLIMLAFFEKAVERIPASQLRTKIRTLIEDKWMGQSGLVSLKDEDIFEWALSHAEEAPAFTDMFEGHYKYRKTVDEEPKQ
jgi:Fe-S cluster assembly scaffold protein SufB